MNAGLRFDFDAKQIDALVIELGLTERQATTPWAAHCAAPPRHCAGCPSAA